MAAIGLLIAIAMTYELYKAAGLLGALTGVAVSLGVASGLMIASGSRSSVLSEDPRLRRWQRAGGLLAAVATFGGAAVVGDRWGWIGALAGYGLAAGLVALLAGKSASSTARAAVATDATPVVLSAAAFGKLFLDGVPVRMDSSIYEGMPFTCGCGSAHSFDRQSTVPVRELSGMRLVLSCPASKFVTVVGIHGTVKPTLRSESTFLSCGVPVS
jgi:hypothetical protein